MHSYSEIDSEGFEQCDSHAALSEDACMEREELINRCNVVGEEVRETLKTIRSYKFEARELTQKLLEKGKEVSQYKALCRSLTRGQREFCHLGYSKISDDLIQAEIMEKTTGVTQKAAVEDLKGEYDAKIKENQALQKTISERGAKQKAELKSIEQQVSTERERVLQLSNELETAISTFHAAKEDYSTNEKLVDQLGKDIEDLKSKQASLTSPRDLDKERHMLEEGIEEFLGILKKKEERLAVLQEQNKTMEDKYSETLRVTGDLEKTVQEIDMECIMKSTELDGMRRERVLLENQILNDATRKEDLVCQIENAKKDSKQLDRKIQDLVKRNDQAQARLSQMNRDYARVLRLNEGLVSENHRLRYELDTAKNRAKISRHEQAQICNEASRKLIQTEYEEMEREISTMTAELNHMRENGMLDESGRLKPVLVSDPELHDIVDDLKINEALLLAQGIPDNEVSMKEVISIVAVVLDRIDTEHQRIQEVFRERALKSMVINQYMQSMDASHNSQAKLDLSNLQLEDRDISKMIDSFNDEQRSKVEWVDISNNPQICGSSLLYIVDRFPNIRELFAVANNPDAIAHIRESSWSKHFDAISETTDDGICIKLYAGTLIRLTITYNE